MTHEAVKRLQCRSRMIYSPCHPWTTDHTGPVSLMSKVLTSRLPLLIKFGSVVASTRGARVQAGMRGTPVSRGLQTVGATAKRSRAQHGSAHPVGTAGRGKTRCSRRLLRTLLAPDVRPIVGSVKLYLYCAVSCLWYAL
jgi:hypothetical protein